MNMYRHSPVRNQRSRGIKSKHVLQVCLLIAVCFWLIFQVKRSHDKKKEFDANNPKNSLTTHADAIVKLGRKELQPKLPTTTETREDTQEQEQEHEHEDEDEHEDNKHEEEEEEEDDDVKIEEEKDDDGGGGGDDEIDESEQEKSTVEIDRDESDILDEDRETEDGQSQNENSVDREEDGSTEHTNEAREEHYKADDASSAVITHDPDKHVKNGTMIQERDSESMNATTSPVEYDENGSPPNTTSMATGYNATVAEVRQGFSDKKSNKTSGEDNSFDQVKDSSDPTHLVEKEVRNDLETAVEIETEGGGSGENTAAE